MKTPAVLRAASLALVVAAAVCSAQAAVNAKTPGPLRIGTDDTVTIAAFHCEEISKSWRVGASGDLELPMVGRVRAAGLTVEELETELRNRLGKFIRDPAVSVVVSDFKSGPVTITGSVDQPGVRQLQGNKRLFDTLMLAGSLKPNAAAVILTRRRDQGEIPWPSARVTPDGSASVARLPVADLREGRGAAANILVLPDDVITVEAEQPKLIHIIGEVTRPGSIELATKTSVPLTRAMAVVGGHTRLARTNKVLLRKIGENGASEVAEIDYKAIMSGKAKDLEITDGYVIIVPSNDLKNYLQAASLTAVNSGIFSGLQILARF
jgi:polysaccharide biosynthesis/export protein